MNKLVNLGILCISTIFQHCNLSYKRYTDAKTYLFYVDKFRVSFLFTNNVMYRNNHNFEKMTDDKQDKLT